MPYEYKLAVDDEEYPQGFSDVPEDEEEYEQEEDEDWTDWGLYDDRDLDDESN